MIGSYEDSIHEEELFKLLPTFMPQRETTFRSNKRSRSLYNYRPHGGSSPSPRQSSPVSGIASTLRGANPCRNMQGIDKAKCIVRSFLYVFILITMTKAISATGALTGLTDIISGNCNPAFWEGAGQLLLGAGAANVSPWCQGWHQVITLIYSAPGAYMVMSALVGLFINTRVLASMTAGAITRFVDEFINLIFLVRPDTDLIATQMDEFPQMTQQQFIDEFNRIRDEMQPSRTRTRTRSGGSKKKKRRSRSKSRSRPRKSRSKKKNTKKKRR